MPFGVNLMRSQVLYRAAQLYLIADVAKIEGLKDICVHSKMVPAFVLSDRC